MRRYIVVLIVLLSACIFLSAQENSEKDKRKKPADKKTFTVAVLDFDGKIPGNPNLGSQIGETLTALLSMEQGFTLVDRAKLSKILQEQELNLTGLVSSEQAVKIGKLAGARILVVGKAFPLGKNIFITAKIIGTETSLVDGVLVKDSAEKDISDLVLQLSGKVAERLKKVGPRLIGKEKAKDGSFDMLQAVLKTLKRPVVAVVVTEQHTGEAARQAAIDPPVETEIKLLLRKCGFEIKDVEQNKLAEWARHPSINSWPKGLAGVDVVITGESFSEFATRIGNLISCVARAEINVISRSDGKIIFVDRATARDVDLAENIAAKKALRKCGNTLGMNLIKYFAKNLPDAEKKAEKDTDKPGKKDTSK